MASKQEKETERRLRVLEGALGIDIDTTCACSGDPTNCPADPCAEERCPMRNNLFRQMASQVKQVAEDVTFLCQFIGELELQGKVPPNSPIISRIRVRHSHLQLEKELAEGVLAQTPSSDFVQKRIDRLNQLIESAEAEILRLRGGS